MLPRMLRQRIAKLTLRTKTSSISLAITALSLVAVAATGIVQLRNQIATEQRRTADSVALGFARAAELALAVRVVDGISTAPTINAQARQSRTTVIVTVAAAILGAIVLFLTLGAAMRRLQRLADASQSLSRGDFSFNIADRSDDEIGRLARSF